MNLLLVELLDSIQFSALIVLLFLEATGVDPSVCSSSDFARYMKIL